MSKYKLKPGKAGKSLIAAYKSIEEKFAVRFLEADTDSPGGYRLKTGKAAEKVTGAYHKVEDVFVDGYKKVEKKFIDSFLEEIKPEENHSKE